MTGRTHDAMAFACLVTIATLNPPESLNVATMGAAIIANIVGGTLPDIDQASNRLWDLLPGGNYLGKIFKNLFLGHRTLTHSFLGVFIVFNLFQLIFLKIFNPEYINGQLIFASFMIGYISHLFGDIVTKDGLPLLFPLKISFGIPPLKFLRIKAGGFLENFVILPGIAAYIFWFIGHFQSEVISLIMLI